MFTAPKGTYDVLPGSGWIPVRDALAAPAARAGYGYLETPVFEDTALFERGVGEATDIVTKEMYTFLDKGGRSVTLRPEGTAGAVRAVLEHNLHLGQLPLKVWYAGPMFRYERPQAGRYRQFQQVGVEVLGLDDPLLDAEVVTLAVRAFEELGLTRVRLLLNSMGDPACRPVYVEELRRFLRRLDLDEETGRRAEVNPLRVLDDKRAQVQAQLAEAPLLADRLCAECKTHYDAVRTGLADVGVAWSEAPTLVRGLDYYRRTTFELQHDGLGAQSAVGGGGRYDGLAESIGGPHLPGIGWALGMERTLLALEAEGRTPRSRPRCDVFGVPLGEQARRALARTVDALRAAGIAADLAYGARGLKGAMKAADRSGARLAIVVGERDLATGVAQLKDLASGEQQAVSLDALVPTVEGRVR